MDSHPHSGQGKDEQERDTANKVKKVGILDGGKSGRYEKVAFSFDWSLVRMSRLLH